MSSDGWQIKQKTNARRPPAWRVRALFGRQLVGTGNAAQRAAGRLFFGSFAGRQIDDQLGELVGVRWYRGHDQSERDSTMVLRRYHHLGASAQQR